MIVLGLPRGGVPVAAEVATAVHAPLDVIVVRKLGFPGHDELAMGAIGRGGVLVLNDEIARRAAPDHVAAVIARESGEVTRQERLFRGDRPPVDIEGRTVVVVDDGLATGATMRAAVAVARALAPARIVVAVPVAPRSTISELAGVADDVVCPLQPEAFRSVGEHYDDFTQTSDAEVRTILASTGEM